MKLTITTSWNGNYCIASSSLPEKRERIQSCISQIQEYVYNLMRIVPNANQILENMISFEIDEVG